MSALRGERGLHRVSGAGPQVVGLTPQTTQKRRANTRKGFVNSIVLFICGSAASIAGAPDASWSIHASVLANGPALMIGCVALLSRRKRRLALGRSVKPLANGQAGFMVFFYARRVRLTSVDSEPDLGFPDNRAAAGGRGDECLENSCAWVPNALLRPRVPRSGRRCGTLRAFLRWPPSARRSA